MVWDLNTNDVHIQIVLLDYSGDDTIAHAHDRKQIGLTVSDKL